MCVFTSVSKPVCHSVWLSGCRVKRETTVVWQCGIRQWMKLFSLSPLVFPPLFSFPHTKFSIPKTHCKLISNSTCLSLAPVGRTNRILTVIKKEALKEQNRTGGRTRDEQKRKQGLGENNVNVHKIKTQVGCMHMHPQPCVIWSRKSGIMEKPWRCERIVSSP